MSHVLNLIFDIKDLTLKVGNPSCESISKASSASQCQSCGLPFQVVVYLLNADTEEIFVKTEPIEPLEEIILNHQDVKKDEEESKHIIEAIQIEAVPLEKVAKKRVSRKKVVNKAVQAKKDEVQGVQPDEDYKPVHIEAAPIKKVATKRVTKKKDVIETKRDEVAVQIKDMSDDDFPCEIEKPTKRKRTNFKESTVMQVYEVFGREIGEDIAGKYKVWQKEIKEPHHERKVLQNGTSVHLYRRTQSKVLYLSIPDPKINDCDLCTFKAKNFNGIIQHYFFHFFEDDSDACLGCGHKFIERNLKLRHALLCTQRDRMREFRCRYNCGKTFPKFKTKKSHELRHRLTRLICEICSKVVSDPYCLKVHLRKRHNIDPYLCAHCPKTFGLIGYLRDHLYKKHFQHLSTFACPHPECSRRFPYERLLRDHLKNHETSNTCETCSKSFASASSLSVHIKLKHSKAEERPQLQCNSCGKVFFAKYNLELHMQTHMEKRFKCKVCNKAYGKKSRQKECEKYHLNPTTCTFCQKTFSQSAYLKQHMTLHTGGKLFECEVCKKQIRDRGNFRAHLKKHEAEMGIKLTFTKEERRLMTHGLLDEASVSQSGELPEN